MNLTCKCTECKFNKLCICSLEEVTIHNGGFCEQKKCTVTQTATFFVLANIHFNQHGLTLEQAKANFLATNPEPEHARFADMLELGYLHQVSPKKVHDFKQHEKCYVVDQQNTPKAVAVWYVKYDHVYTY